jgi:Domain of unknown function (DUF397)
LTPEPIEAYTKQSVFGSRGLDHAGLYFGGRTLSKPSFSDARFFKSSFSSGEGSGCVEAAMDEDHIAVRDSKDPAGGILVFNRREWTAFIEGVKRGEFDLNRS